uniref:Sodium/hydrogen exchanger n=1 Tax=Syphacia muris TaxID=451379 RepID=A0A0N5AS93_9BILA
MISIYLCFSLSNDTTKMPLIEPEGSEEVAEEKRSSLATFFILMVIVAATLLVHLLIVTNFYYIPESLAIVMLGAFIGLVLSYSKRDWSQVESFNPNFFFLVLLPPIIFESGYNLHKGDFFANMLPILTFAIVGTAISAFVIGSGLYILGEADLIYRLSAVESFAFGSMISAVDPVATLAIFQALNVDPMLYMLVFGESMLNDAVSIVLTSTALRMSDPKMSALSTVESIRIAIFTFTSVFFVSAAIGAAIGLLSALLFKHVDLRKTPSLELALLLVFAYLPYGFAEALSLSGIMAILFCSITMSQFTHFNVSPITQMTMQQTLRTVSFIAETCTFAYLGMALFTIELAFEPMFILWSILLCLISRGMNVFPLSFIVNKCRHVQISLKNQFIMWLSGMRGAVAFALALHISIENETTKRMLLTTALFILLFTIIFLGGSTLPFIKILNEVFSEKKHSNRKRRLRRRRERQNSKSQVMLSKTQEMVIFDHSEQMTSAAEDTGSISQRHFSLPRNRIASFIEHYVKPVFVRKFTLQEKLENKMKLKNLASEVLSKTALESVNFDTSSEGELFNSSRSAAEPLLN